MANQPRVYQIAVKDSHKTEKRGHGLGKISVERLVVNVTGCEGDFNKYRTDHKDSTNDRAVSIMTKQLLTDLTNEGWGHIMPGDLGENITTDGRITFEIGGIYSVGSVLLQITENIEPCNKLIYLPYIKKERKNDFLKTLKGRRGWYAKVLNEGIIFPGDKIIIK